MLGKPPPIPDIVVGAKAHHHLTPLPWHSFRLLEISACCDFSFLVDLLGAVSALQDCEGISDCLEIIYRILQDDNCCTIAVLAGDSGSDSSVDDDFLHLRNILKSTSLPTNNDASNKIREILMILDGLNPLNSPTSPAIPPPTRASGVKDVVSALEAELEEAKKGLEDIQEEDDYPSRRRRQQQHSRASSSACSMEESKMPRMENDQGMPPLQDDIHEEAKAAAGLVDAEAASGIRTDSPSTVSLVSVAERLAGDYLQREKAVASSSSSHRSDEQPSRLKLLKEPELVLHELAKSLQQCFTKLVGRSTFRCGWRYAYSPNGYYLDDSIGVDELKTFVQQCGIYKKDKDKKEPHTRRTPPAHAHVPRYEYLMRCVSGAITTRC